MDLFRLPQLLRGQGHKLLLQGNIYSRKACEGSGSASPWCHKATVFTLGTHPVLTLIWLDGEKYLHWLCSSGP